MLKALAFFFSIIGILVSMTTTLVFAMLIFAIYFRSDEAILHWAHIVRPFGLTLVGIAILLYLVKIISKR
jgi:uncharacterized membrane protein YbaN (DUF454 family)